MTEATTQTRPAHTPGPWQLKQYLGTTEISGPESSGVIVARIADWGVSADSTDPQDANARLIAAAPNLLRELEAAHRIIRNALAVLSTEQKIAWGHLNAAAGVNGEGVTRANEREAVIASATGAAS